MLKFVDVLKYGTDKDNYDEGNLHYVCLSSCLVYLYLLTKAYTISFSTYLGFKYIDSNKNERNMR